MCLDKASDHTRPNTLTTDNWIEKTECKYIHIDVAKKWVGDCGNSSTQTYPLGRQEHNGQL